jgi:hypothetical protein
MLGASPLQGALPGLNRVLRMIMSFVAAFCAILGKMFPFVSQFLQFDLGHPPKFSPNPAFAADFPAIPPYLPGRQ